MNAYTKLFTTNPPIVTKTIPPHPWYNVFAIVVLLFIAGLCITSAMVSGTAIEEPKSELKLKSKFKFFLDKGYMFFMMISFTAAAIMVLILAVLLGINLNKPTHEQVVSPNAPRIEKAAIQQVHREYPYVLTIGPSDDGDSPTRYLLKKEPHKAVADLYKLRFADDSKPYIEHIGYRSLPATRSCSVNNSTGYLQDKVDDKNNPNRWEEPEKPLSGVEGLWN